MVMRTDAHLSVLLFLLLWRSCNFHLEEKIIQQVWNYVIDLDVKKIKQGRLQFYVLKRMNFMYIFWAKAEYADLRLYSMVEMLHYQLMSCLTSKVNAIIDQNQTYDPTINFGKGPAVMNLLQYALTNGLNSLPVLFNAAPILLLSNQARNQISSILNIK